MKHTLFIFFVALLGTHLTFAQDFNDPLNHCDKVLEDGIRDTLNVQTLNMFRGYLRQSINYSLDQLRSAVQSNDTSLGIPLPVVDAIVSASAQNTYNNHLFEELRQRYSSDTTIDLNQQDAQSFTLSVVNRNLLDRWLECIGLLGQRENKLMYFVSGKENEIFAVTFIYRPQSDTDSDHATVQELTVIGGSDVNAPVRIRAGAVLRQFTGYTQTFRRKDPSAATSIRLDLAGQGSVQVIVPGLKRQDVLPVGTILASTLPWPQFAESVGDQGAFKAGQNKWAPCDSRSILGSELARLGGIGNAPDLRGIFLRGLNKFSTEEPNAVQRDPEPNRIAGSYQGDTFASHSHSFGFAMGDHDGEPNHFPHRANRQVAGFGADTSAVGGSETRPKNVAVFYYVKIN